MAWKQFQSFSHQPHTLWCKGRDHRNSPGTRLSVLLDLDIELKSAWIEIKDKTLCYTKIITHDFCERQNITHLNTKCHILLLTMKTLNLLRRWTCRGHWANDFNLSLVHCVLRIPVSLNVLIYFFFFFSFLFCSFLVSLQNLQCQEALVTPLPRQY